MSTDPQIRQVEKMMEKEAKADQKTLSHAIKDLTGVEKNHDKSIKVSDRIPQKCLFHSPRFPRLG